MMEQAKTTQLAQFQLQVEEQLKLDGLRAEQEALMMVDGLKEAAITQQTAREEAAARAVADFNKKKSLEEYQAKSWGVQKNWFEQEQKMTAEYQAAMKEGSRALGNYNAGQVNVNAPGRMASYTAAPQYTTVAAAPQYTTVAAPMMQTIAAPVVEIDQVNAVGQVVERDFVGATTIAAPQITYGAPQYTTVAAAPQYATVAGATMMAPQTVVAA